MMNIKIRDSNTEININQGFCWDISFYGMKYNILLIEK